MNRTASQSPSRVVSLFEAAVELANAGERARFLDGECSDPELRKEVEALLTAHDEPDTLFTHQTVRVLAPLTEEPGQFIGRYKLLEKLGEGGMGVVYLAEQEEPVRRQVALKLIKAGMDTRQVVVRFEAERQALALMDHPNIAKVLDGGVTGTADSGSSGRESAQTSPSENPSRLTSAATTTSALPYFVMELVRGARITDYVREHALPLAARLELFLQVCSAVQHAHQKGIIHRDLKPSNILVTEVDGKPVPKVIDFGVAKALHGKLTDKTIHTQISTLIGTPAYMSPEQAEMTSSDIDTRSDIYSLGVLLYELLAGSPPFSEERLRTAGYAEMHRIIREEEPERPSRRLTRELVAAPRESAANSTGLKSSDPEQGPSNHENCGALTSRRDRQDTNPLNSQLKSLSTDLDWIVMKCLEKDRNRRYETASALAADIERHLGHEPVLARPPSRIYRLGKFVGRNKLHFAAGAIVTNALLVAAVISTVQAWRAKEAEEISREQAILARKAEQAQAVGKTLAEQRLRITLSFVDRLFRDIGNKLWQIAGTREVSEMLATNGVAFLEQLRDGAEITPEFRTSVANLYVRLAQSQAWDQGNTAADYESGLQRAEQAIGLFQTLNRASLSPDSIRQLARVHLIAGTASKRLFRFEDAIQHFRQAEHWARLLTNYPAFASAGQTLMAAAPGGCVGDVLIRMGRVNEALTNHFQPFLRAMEARHLSEERPNVFDLAHLHGAHGCLGRAYSALELHQEALQHRREALRLMEGVLKAEPNAAEFISSLPVIMAELGESLLACHDPEGLGRLQQANEKAEALVAQDNRNAGFAETRIEVLRLSARGFTHWVGAPDTIPDERRARLIRARQYIADAGEQLNHLVSEAQRKWLGIDLQSARAFLSAAESKLQDALPQEHGPPALRSN